MNTKTFTFTALTMLFAFISLSGLIAQNWDERPGTDFSSVYLGDFTQGVWDQTAFDNQWQQVESFYANHIAGGYLSFIWTSRRIICSSTKYSIPYAVEGRISYGSSSNRGGMVIRAKMTEGLQEPPSDPGFNTEAIAFYPADGNTMIIQFTAADNSTQSQIMVETPSGTVDLMSSPFTLRTEDYGSSIYVFIDDSPLARIDLSDLNENVYSSGTVYNPDMTKAGTFSGMEVLKTGHVAFCQRDADLELYKVDISEGTYTDTYDITFKITTDGEALEGASIIIDDEILDTDANGEIVFSRIMGTYNYGVHKFGYEEFTGSVTVSDQAVNLSVSLTKAEENPDPEYTFAPDYLLNVADHSEWSEVESSFNQQWDVIDKMNSGYFYGNNYLILNWMQPRVIASKSTCQTPYAFEAEISFPDQDATGGLIIRHDSSIAIENMQEPGNITDIVPMFNREGIAIFPTLSGEGMYVQFSGPISTDNEGYSTDIKRIEVPAPNNMDFRGHGTIRIEDYGTYIYAFYNDTAIVRIELREMVENNYTSGTVYNGNMVPIGEVSGVEVIDKGKVGIAIRHEVTSTYSLYVYSMSIEVPATVPDAPTEVSASLINVDTVQVSFTAPENNGGIEIGSYTVTSSPDGITQTGEVSPIIITGLNYNTSYTFTVIATNEVGDSEASESSNEVTTGSKITSIEDAELAKVKVYQSNAGIVVDMQNLCGVQNIFVYNTSGRLVYSQQSEGGSIFTIDNNLETGIYFVTVLGDGKINQTKIVIE